MPSLPELQAAFARGVFDSAEAAIADAIVSDDLPAAERIAVYRGNVLGNYASALRDVYPVILRLVGGEFFDALARRYARQVASRSGDLHDFGEALATFLEDFPPIRELPYLPDVARLEWAVHRVFHAAHVDPLDPAALAAVPPEALPQTRFALHPAARLIQSDYPVLDIWCVNQPEWSDEPGAVPDGEPAGKPHGAPDEKLTGEPGVDLARGAQRVLIIRRALEVELEPLSPAEHAMLAACAAGLELGAAFEAALDLDPEFDLTAFLARHVLGTTLCGLRPGG